MANKHMSLESMLDEERRDVLALLEGTPSGRPRGSASSTGSGSGRAASPFTSPRSPVRSMLDIDEGAAPRHASIAGTNTGVTSPPRAQQPIRSMLDINGSSPPPVPPIRSMLDLNGSPPAKASTKSAQTSPTEANHRAHMANNLQHRSLSDAASRPAEFGPRAVPRPNDPSAYQFSGYLTNNPGGPVVPKRNTQAGKKGGISNAMAEVVRGGDLSTFGLTGRDRGRNQSIAGTGISTTAKSKSPHNRLGLRSNSPHASILSPDPTKFTLADGRVIDMNSAYRRLSDANLALSGGGLSSLSEKGRRRRTNSGDVDPDGARLEKDYTPLDGEDALLDSSDEDYSDDERNRGRKKDGRDGEGGGEDSDPESKTIGMGRAKGPRTALSLMAAAEEERKSSTDRFPVLEFDKINRPRDCCSATCEIQSAVTPGARNHCYGAFRG